MHKLYIVALFVIVFVAALLNFQYSRALSANILISQVKVGNSATSRLVEVYNNSDLAVDITDWCLYYSSPSNTSPYTNLGCFANSNPVVHVFINARSHALLASSQTGLTADIVLASGLGSGTSGHIYLMDNAGNEVDRVGWGTAIHAEANRPIPLNSTKVIERKQDTTLGTLIDTDNNENDFINSTLRSEYQYGAIYEVTDICDNISGVQEIIPIGYEVDVNGDCSPPPVDVCPNIDGMQIAVPVGYELDEMGDCQVDICLNIDGLQLILPGGMDLDENGDCVQHDECLNLPSIQSDIPDGYKRGVGNTCILDLLPLQITELLPNAVGSDVGHEFIEIYNPNDSDINLANYVMYVGDDDVNYFSFPIDSHIGPGQYMAFSNSDIKFTLFNANSSVRLRSIDNSNIDETPAYYSPGDDMAWALIDNVWQYTNRPTPGSVNLDTFIEVVVEKEAEPTVTNNLEPCAANQYRNPETNRCRQIVTPSSTLAPCKDGQYRSEETNRCRSIASDVVAMTPCAEGQERNPQTNRCRQIVVAVSTLTPCKDGQYRSEETNRCRSIVSDVAPLVSCAEGQERNPETNRCRQVTTAVLGASDLAPCKEGQERNPETNRCRNIVSAIPQAEYAPEQTFESSNNYVVWWSLAGVGVVAVIYGIWEWRQEIMNLVRKFGSFRHSGK